MRTRTLRSPGHDPMTAGDTLQEARSRLRHHRLYGVIRTSAALRTFTEHHVVCVLDFMSLLKSLQREFTCVAVPWTPPEDPESARLIQSIVLDEETDVRADGRVQSHFAWYLEAMEEIGANTQPMRTLVDALVRGSSLPEALRSSGLPPGSRAFGESTAAFLARPLHVRAAVFFHGREEVIPEMFLPILDRLEQEGLPCATLRAYLLRHIEVDRSHHGPLAKRMLSRLYRDDLAVRAEAELAALDSLRAREQLWDAIAAAAGARG